MAKQHNQQPYFSHHHDTRYQRLHRVPSSVSTLTQNSAESEQYEVSIEGDSADTETGTGQRERNLDPNATHNGNAALLRPTDNIPTANADSFGQHLAAFRQRISSETDFELDPEPDARHDNPGSALLGSAKSPQVEDVSSNHAKNGYDIGWSPFWLRPIILCIFLALFLLCTIVLPTMLLYSQRNDGLVESPQDFTYVWRFVPTAIVTIIGIFWSRVEFQTLRYAPWIALKSGQPFDSDLYNLDYTSMITLAVPIRSLQRKNYFVFIIAVAGLILKAQVVLSASLFQLKHTWTSKSVQVRVLDSFKVTRDFNDGPSPKTVPYYNARALENFDMMYPFGVSEEGAYQTFRMTDQGAATRGTIDAPLTVVVDGAFLDMKCLKSEDCSASRIENNDVSTWYNFTVDLKFENCDQSVKVNNGPLTVESGFSNFSASWTIYNQLETKHPCSSLPRQNPSFVYFGGYYAPSSQNSSLPELDACAAILCSPRAWISKVKIIDDGIEPKLTVLPDQDKVNIKSNPLTMLQNSIPSLYGQVGISSAVLVRGPVAADLQFMGQQPNASDMSLYNSDVLLNALSNLTEKINPMLSHYLLAQEVENQTITGSLAVKAYKLHINKFSCIFMTILFSISTIMALWAILHSRKASYVWHTDPATILGAMLFFHSKTEQSNDIKSHLSKGRENKKAEWANTTYSPIILRTWARSLFTLLVIGMIAGLIVTLEKSETSAGLVAYPKEDGYWPFLWTSLPTLIMLGVSLYVNATNTAVRDLATLLNLSIRNCDSRELDTSLINMLGFRALYHSIRIKAPAVTLAQILTIVCAFLASLSAVLFTVQSTPSPTEVQFQQESWFGSKLTESEKSDRLRQDLSSFILTRRMSNFTYPQHTYADLVFPSLGLEDIEWNSNISAKVRTPAAKVAPTCSQLSDKDFEITIDNADRSDGKLPVTITQHFTCSNGTDQSIWDSMSLEGINNEVIAGVVTSPQNLVSISGSLDCDADMYEGASESPWGVQAYIWGQFSSSKMDFDHLSIWRCNYSWAEVETDVRLVWANGAAQIDHQNPPTQRNSNTKPWSPPFSVPSDIFKEISAVFPEVELKDSVTSIGVLGPFPPLLEPFGPVAVEDFGKPEQDAKILEALNFNLGLISAQLANAEHRLGLDEESTTTPARHGDLAPVDATIANYGRRALVQNSNITFALMGILWLVVIVNACALVSTLARRMLKNKPRWLLDMSLEGLAPDGFNSIAGIESLLYGSNALRGVPTDAHLMPLNELHRLLSERCFRLGWFHGRGDGREFTIGAANDEEFPLLGNKLEIEKLQHCNEE